MPKDRVMRVSLHVSLALDVAQKLEEIAGWRDQTRTDVIERAVRGFHADLVAKRRGSWPGVRVDPAIPEDELHLRDAEGRTLVRITNVGDGGCDSMLADRRCLLDAGHSGPHESARSCTKCGNVPMGDLVGGLCATCRMAVHAHLLAKRNGGPVPKVGEAFEQGSVKSEPEPFTGISFLSCPCGKRGLRVCECGAPHPDSPTGRLLRNKANADPEVEEQAKPVGCLDCQRGIHIGHKAADGSCSVRACPCPVRVTEPDPEAEQQAVEARQERKEKRAQRKADLQESLSGAMRPRPTLPEPTQQGPQPTLDATGGKAAFQSFPKPTRKGTK